MEITWVTSLGGPLILVPQSACPLWGGAPPNYPDEEGDYGRACAVDGYIGLIDVGHAKALVLGDYPARTTFLPDYSILLREIAGANDEEVITAALGTLPTIDWESQLTWHISEPLILFDSAWIIPTPSRPEKNNSASISHPATTPPKPPTSKSPTPLTSSWSG
jgi:Immunity protein 21